MRNLQGAQARLQVSPWSVLSRTSLDLAQQKVGDLTPAAFGSILNPWGLLLTEYLGSTYYVLGTVKHRRCSSEKKEERSLPSRSSGSPGERDVELIITQINAKDAAIICHAGEHGEP